MLLKETFTTYLTCVFIYLFQLNDDDDTLQQQRLKDMRKGVKVLRKMERQRRGDPYNMSTRVYKCSTFRLYPLRQLFNNYLKLHAVTPEIIDLMIQAADYGALEEVHRVRDNQLKPTKETIQIGHCKKRCWVWGMGWTSSIFWKLIDIKLFTIIR